MIRPSDRMPDELRKIELEINVNKHAEGSCSIKCGDTHVICTATIEDKVPKWIKDTGEGWVTAEYGMLPRSTDIRMDRESKKDKPVAHMKFNALLVGRCVAVWICAFWMDFKLKLTVM